MGFYDDSGRYWDTAGSANGWAQPTGQVDPNYDLAARTAAYVALHTPTEDSAILIADVQRAGTYGSNVPNAATGYVGLWPSTLGESNEATDAEGAWQDAINRGDIAAAHAALDAYNSVRARLGVPNVPITNIPSDLTILSHAKTNAGIAADQVIQGVSIQQLLYQMTGSVAFSPALVERNVTTPGPTREVVIDGPPSPQATAKANATSFPAAMVAAAGASTLGPDQWGYYYQQITGEAAPAPEQMGLIRGTPYTIEAWWNALRPGDPTRTVYDGTPARTISGVPAGTAPTGSVPPNSQQTGTIPPGTGNDTGAAASAAPNSPPKATAAGAVAAQIQTAAGDPGIKLGPDQWGYYYAQVTGTPAPAPEQMGVVRGTPYLFSEWWAALDRYSKQATGTPAANGGGTSAPVVKKSSTLMLLLGGGLLWLWLRKGAA